jgi:glucosamine--fructose-6-phosphate aminotransferase (isomerizing)
MCGVVGYAGKNYSKAFILEGLSRLEYRGYDSAGLACISPTDNRLNYVKSTGQLKNLQLKSTLHPVDGHLGIGHTRWATHGTLTEDNTHPIFDCQKTISIVHNGIIENHHEMREALRTRGHTFHSDTDTEIIAHRLEELLPKHKTLKGAVTELVGTLEGAYAFIAIAQSFPNQMVVVRKRSPMCLGIGNDEMFIASDPLAFADRTKKVVYLPDETFAIVGRSSYELYNFAGDACKAPIQEFTIAATALEKHGHEHFMLKEIYEQKSAIAATLRFYNESDKSLYKQMGITRETIQKLSSLNLIGCGTSWHAARIGQFFFEEICKIPTRVLLASEFRYMPFFADPNSVGIAISQSGETADTLEGMRLVSGRGIPIVTLTNVASSTMVREANGFLLTHAGPEIAVASTKAFSTQIALLFWLANRIALEKGLVTKREMQDAQADLLIAAEVLENTIEIYKHKILTEIAPYYSQFKRAIFLGRHISYPFALEAALKLKEISYIFAQCYPAGELKHGPIALIDDQTPVILFSVLDAVVYPKLVASAQEVKARKGHLVVFAFEGQQELMSLADQLFVLPRVHPLLGPLAMTGIMQFFAYAIARELGCAIDKPRNLAKSLTVE